MRAEGQAHIDRIEAALALVRKFLDWRDHVKLSLAAVRELQAHPGGMGGAGAMVL